MDGACSCFSRPTRYTGTFAPLWVTVRGGASARVDGRPLDAGDGEGSGLEEEGGGGGGAMARGDEDDRPGEGVGAAGGGAGAAGGGSVDGAGEQEEEVGVGGQEETETSTSQEKNDDDDDDEDIVESKAAGSEDAARATTPAKGRPSESGKSSAGVAAATKEAPRKEAAAGTGAGEAGKAAGVPVAETSSPSVVQTLELGKVVPALIKQGAVFFMGTWLSKKLSPAVEGQVRAARVIYTAYLIFSQALCMYLR